MADIGRVSGRVVAHHTFKARGTTSEKVEIVIVTEVGHLARVTLWPPHNVNQFEIGDLATIEKPRLLSFYGRSFSTVQKSIVGRSQGERLPEVSELRLTTAKTTGGIKFESLDSLRGRVGDRPSFGYIKGRFVSFEHEFTYAGCSTCKKALKESKMLCGCGAKAKQWARLKFHIIPLEQGSWIKITAFDDAVSSLFGQSCDAILAKESGIEQIRSQLDRLMDQTVGFAVKAEQKSFESDEDGTVQYVQFTARKPFFALEV